MESEDSNLNASKKIKSIYSLDKSKSKEEKPKAKPLSQNPDFFKNEKMVKTQFIQKKENENVFHSKIYGNTKDENTDMYNFPKAENKETEKHDNLVNKNENSDMYNFPKAENKETEKNDNFDNKNDNEYNFNKDSKVFDNNFPNEPDNNIPKENEYKFFSEKNEKAVDNEYNFSKDDNFSKQFDTNFPNEPENNIPIENEYKFLNKNEKIEELKEENYNENFKENEKIVEKIEGNVEEEKKYDENFEKKELELENKPPEKIVVIENKIIDFYSEIPSKTLEKISEKIFFFENNDEEQIFKNYLLKFEEKINYFSLFDKEEVFTKIITNDEEMFSLFQNEKIVSYFNAFTSKFIEVYICSKVSSVKFPGISSHLRNDAEMYLQNNSCFINCISEHYQTYLKHSEKMFKNFPYSKEILEKFWALTPWFSHFSTLLLMMVVHIIKSRSKDILNFDFNLDQTKLLEEIKLKDENDFFILTEFFTIFNNSSELFGTLDAYLIISSLVQQQFLDSVIDLELKQKVNNIYYKIYEEKLENIKINLAEDPLIESKEACCNCSIF